MGSARLREHPRLTVSTEQGMLHYALQPATGLLFLAITHPDMPQSAAFSFLESFKNEIARKPDFSQLLRTKDDAELATQATPVLRGVLRAHNTRYAQSARLTLGAEGLQRDGVALGLGDLPQAAAGGEGDGEGEGEGGAEAGAEAGPEAEARAKAEAAAGAEAEA